MYLFLDGTYLKLRPEAKRAIAVLCAYAMRWDGRKVLLHLAVGDKESRAGGLHRGDEGKRVERTFALCDRRPCRIAPGGQKEVCRLARAALPSAQDAQHHQQASPPGPTNP